MSSTSSKTRPYQIVLLGATGYTGKLTAQHLSKSKDVSSWAIAGRDEKRLQAVANDIVQQGGSKPDVLTFQLDDQNQLDNVISKAKVAIASVGPYALHGEPIVASCIRNRTHYCDITGESVWVSKMIEKYEDEAIKNHVKLIPFSGFDSIPSDLSTYFASKTFSQTFNKPVEHVQNYFTTNGGGVSGGTLHTVMNMLDNKNVLKIAMQKYHLNPSSDRQQKESNFNSLEKDQILPAYANEIKRWSVPFLMSGVNTRVVRRTAALFQQTGQISAYASNFSYNEAMLVPNFISAFLFTLIMGVGMLLLQFGFVRNLAKKWFPQGSGPKSNKGTFTVRSVAKSGSNTQISTFRGPEAYYATGIFCAEIAILLSDDKIESEVKGKVGEAGFLTPVAAYGNRLLERLTKNESYGMKFEVQKSA